jgi:hypothetical protein
MTHITHETKPTSRYTDLEKDIQIHITVMHSNVHKVQDQSSIIGLNLQWAATGLSPHFLNGLL